MANGSNKSLSETEKRSVSAPADLLAEADKIMVRRHMNNFSEYVRDLIRRDMQTNGHAPAVAGKELAT